MSQAVDPARRVVVTGLGCVTPLGLDAETTWGALVEGRSGVRPISRFDTSDYAVKIAAEVQGEPNLGDVSPREVRRMDRCILLALGAAREAVSDASIAFEGSSGNRAGVAIGSGIGGLSSITANQDLLREKGPRRVPPFTIPMGISNMSSGIVSIQYGLRGPNLCHVSACTSGAHSIGEAARMIERGDVDVMLAGGTEAPIIELGVASFASMRALSTRNDDPAAASRPFDRGRDGFVMGEGAGVLVLESLAHARARGAHIRAELGGYAATADAANIAAPGENGAGPIAAMVQSLADAGGRCFAGGACQRSCDQYASGRSGRGVRPTRRPRGSCPECPCFGDQVHDGASVGRRGRCRGFVLRPRNRDRRRTSDPEP